MWMNKEQIRWVEDVNRRGGLQSPKLNMPNERGWPGNRYYVALQKEYERKNERWHKQ